MKIRFLFFYCVSVLTVAVAQAQTAPQSSVDLSGQVDTALRYSTNTSPTGQSKIGMGAAPDGNGIVRFRGIEDLGDDISAHFKLESQFLVNSGAQVSSPANAVYGLFGRESSVGLRWGGNIIDAGRLQGIGTGAQPLVIADPTNAKGYYTETLWPGVYVGLRFDNALRYQYLSGPWSATLLHAFGNQAGSSSASSINTTTVGYRVDNVKTMAAYQVVKDNKSNSDTTMTLGATLDVMSSLTLHASYLHANADKGFAGIPHTGIVAPLSPLLSAQTMNMEAAGITCRFTDTWTLKSEYFNGRSDGGSFLPSTQNGKIQTAYAVLEYAMSKRSKLVSSVDYNDWTGGYAGYWGSSAEQLTGLKFGNGKNTRMNISLGVEHLF